MECNFETQLSPEQKKIHGIVLFEVGNKTVLLTFDKNNLYLNATHLGLEIRKHHFADLKEIFRLNHKYLGCMTNKDRFHLFEVL